MVTFIELIEDYKKAIINNPKKIKEIVGKFIVEDTEFEGIDNIREKIRNLKHNEK